MFTSSSGCNWPIPAACFFPLVAVVFLPALHVKVPRLMIVSSDPSLYSLFSVICSSLPSWQGNLANLCLLWPTARCWCLSLLSALVCRAKVPYTLSLWSHGRFLASRHNGPWSIASRQIKLDSSLLVCEVSLHPSLGRRLLQVMKFSSTSYPFWLAERPVVL